MFTFGWEGTTISPQKKKKKKTIKTNTLIRDSGNNFLPLGLKKQNQMGKILILIYSRY